MKAYRSDWADFQKFCGGREVASLPPSAATLAAYLAEAPRRLKANTIGRPWKWRVPRSASTSSPKSSSAWPRTPVSASMQIFQLLHGRLKPGAGRQVLFKKSPGFHPLFIWSTSSLNALATPRAVRIYELTEQPLEAAASEIIARQIKRESQQPGLLSACRTYLP